MDIRQNIAMVHEDVEMPGGWMSNQTEKLKMIDLYYNGKFKSGQYDNRGFRKFFTMIGKPTCDVAEKFVDIDTKDITLTPEDHGDEFKVLLMQKRLRQWMKDEYFAELLNEISHNYPKYGHVVVNVNTWKLVMLQNLRLDPAAPSLDKSSFVYEVHFMSTEEIEAKNWNGDKVQDLTDRNVSNIHLIYECYTKKGDKWDLEIKGGVYDQKGKTNTKAVEALINNKGDQYLPAITLHEQKDVKLPYRELKWEHVPGRWLGKGYMELLEDNQIAENEAENLERKGLVYTSLKLYQTRDESIGGSNILTSAENGDIINIESEIQPVANEERNLAAFNATRTRCGQSTERLTFTTDIARGESLPSRTPFGVASLQAGMVTSFFNMKQEKYGLFLKRLLYEDAIPSFKNDTALEHRLVFSGNDEEIALVDKAIIAERVAQSTLEFAQKTGFFPSSFQIEDAKMRIEESINRETKRYLKVPKNFYKNPKYSLDITITGESMNIGKQTEIMNTALQIVGTNPAVLQNPMTRDIFFELLDKNGYNTARMRSVEMDQTPLPVAGSVAGGGGQAQAQQGQAETAI